MNDHREVPAKTPQRVVFFLLFLAFGLLIFVVFSHMRPIFPAGLDLAGRFILTIGFLAAALLARGNQRFNRCWQVPFAFFIASLAAGLDYYLPTREWLLRSCNLSINTPAGLALDKLDSSLTIILTVILLTKVSGGNLSDLFLTKGNISPSLLIGFPLFLIFAAGSLPAAEIFFGARDLQIYQAVSWTPWILIFVLTNAFNEELLFRGLFLGKFDPFLGKFLSNLVIAIPFALHHSGVAYSPDMLMFLALLIPLALAWGWVTQKTSSLWGAVLFHAGTDIPVALAIFSALR